MQFHDDGAAFYTLARQQGTHVVDNWANTIQWAQLTGAYPVAGIYADNYSEFITFERNANVNCSDDINQNTGGGVQNIRLISNVTTAEPTITDYAGRKANYVWPTKIEAESMTITGGTSESAASAYSNDAGITFSAAGNLSTTFAGAAGTYNLHAAYVTGSSAAASYVLRVNGTSVDSWTAELTPAGTGLQIRHRIKRAVTLPAGAVIRLDVTPVSGTPAKVDYLEIYGRQLATPLAPEGLTANAVSATKIALTWEGWTGEATPGTYTISGATSLAGPFTNVATGITSTTWMDSHLVQDTPYFYRVTMTTALGTSPASQTVSATPRAFSGMTTLEARADAFVRAGSHAATNFGTTATTLVVKNSATADTQRKSYIRFDLTGQDIRATPNASLQFAVSSAWVDATPLQVYGLKNADAGESWGERTITWNNAPANTTSSGDGLVSSGQTLTIDPTNDLGPGVGYHALVDSTAIIDTSGGDAFAGISSTIAWNFTTAGTPVLTFSSWISNPTFGLALADQDLGADPDGDGIPNGVENFFGTNPGTFTLGLAAGIRNGNTLTFSHPQGALATDLTASYRWSTDLSTFHLGGVTSGGTTVNFITEANTPSPGFTRVTATAAGTLPGRLFVDVNVTGP